MWLTRGKSVAGRENSKYKSAEMSKEQWTEVENVAGDLGRSHLSQGWEKKFELIF